MKPDYSGAAQARSARTSTSRKTPASATSSSRRSAPQDFMSRSSVSAGAAARIASRRVERAGDLRAQIEQHLRSESLAADALAQRLPLEQLHGNEALAVVLADFVDRADVRMVE